MRRQNEDLKAELQSFKSETNQLLRNMNLNVRKLYRSPAVVVNRDSEGQEQERLSSNSLGEIRTIPLIKCPRTLEVLWTEYEFGLNGNKPAKAFTARERGKVKYSYSLRKPYWNLVENMIRYGYTHASAIEKIEGIYSAGTSKSITQILREIRSDSRRGGHPLLRYN